MPPIMVAFEFQSNQDGLNDISKVEDWDLTNLQQYDTFTQNQWYMPMRQGGFFTPPALNTELSQRSIESILARPKGVSKNWWDQIDRQSLRAAKFFLKYDFIRKQKPKEQLIIGRDGLGIRFYNYGEALDEESIAQCEHFVAMADGHFGIETVQERLSDIIFVALKSSSPDRPIDLGYRSSAFPGSIFVHNDMKEYARRNVSFFHVIAHEFGHTFESQSTEHDAALYKFGEALGWNMKCIAARFPSWATGDVDLGARGLAPQVMDNQTRGVPTKYGKRNIRESLAETVALQLSGKIDEYPWLQDALTQYMADIDVNYTPKSYDEVPEMLFVDHRVGDDILYPF